MAQDREQGRQARARRGLAAPRLGRARFALAVLLAAAATLSASVFPGAAPATAAGSAPYYVFVLTNVASPGNIWVGQVSDLAGKDTCEFTDGGLCANAGGQDVPVTYTENLGPYATCAAATAAYNAAAMSPHPAFGGEKVYIFGNSYFIDDMSGWCVPGSSTTTTTTTTTPTTTTPGTTEPLPPLPQAFCRLHAVRATAAATVCAPHKTLTPLEKEDAREDLRAEVLAAIVYCGGGAGALQGRRKANRVLAIELLLELCPIVVRMMGDTLVQVHDPPVAGYQQVALVQAFAPPVPSGACPAGSSASACAALRAAASAYARTIALTVAVTAADALTTDRFAAAVAANSPSGAFLQAALGKVYGGAVDGELAVLHKDSLALAEAYQNAGVTIDVGAASALQAISQPGSTILSTTLLNQLVADGVASSAALARQAVVAQLGAVTGTLNSITVLDEPLPASAFATPYFAITLSDLTTIVKALRAQSAVTGKAATSLLGDLAAAAKACGKRTAFIAATKAFSATATGVVKGEAGATLAFAVRPLTANSIPFASCA